MSEHKNTKFEINPEEFIDAYKLGHITMKPEGTTRAYCNLTARNFKHAEKLFPNDIPFFDNKVVVYGTTMAVRGIIELWNVNFFDKPINNILKNLKKRIRPFIGDNDDKVILDSIEALHKLGYLPLSFKTLPEGTLVSPGIPMMTWTNTHDDFAWLPSYLETTVSTETWKLPTAATIARVYKNIMLYYAELTGVDKSFCDIQGHDFSPRGLSGMHDTTGTGTAHSTSFIGSDNVPAVSKIEYYYEVAPGEIISLSVPATEHSVMCMHGKVEELETFIHLLKMYPTGVISIVSDTWDYWDLISEKTKLLKEAILARKPDSNGLAKTVFRPDSGDPVDIICGTYNSYNVNFKNSEKHSETLSPQQKGSVHVLDEIFGHDLTEKGFRTLNQKVGLIYGDSITPVRAHNILRKLMGKGYSSGNIVFGIGSYTYQFITRDTFGFAVKTTAATINDKIVLVAKAPKTDSGKRSAIGYMRVDKIAGEYVLVDNLETDEGGYLEEFARDGKFFNIPSWSTIKGRLDGSIN